MLKAIGVAMLIMFGVMVAISMSSSEEPGSEGSGVTPTFKGTVQNFYPENPAALRIIVKVKNTGTVSGEAECHIRAHDDSGTYEGFDFVDVPTLAPKESTRFNVVLTIENEGASFVTDATADCSAP